MSEIPKRFWNEYQKEIADDHYFYERSCIRQTFFPGSEDEKSLSSWMRQNLVFYFKPNDEYAMMEDLLIALFNPPLNLDKNENPVNGAFRDRLKAHRRNRP